MANRKHAWEFAEDLKTYVNLVKQNADLVVEAIVTELFTKIVQRTPVRTGRAAGSWFISINEVNTGRGAGVLPKSKVPYAGGEGLTSRQAGTARQVALDRLSKLNRSGGGRFSSETTKKFFIYNNLPYIQRLEYGWSKQAPFGMIRISLAEMKAKIRSAIKAETK